jgi:hypothetical protein
VTLAQATRYTLTLTSTDRGRTWAATIFNKMARHTGDRLLMRAASVAAKTFAVDGDWTDHFVAGVKLQVGGSGSGGQNHNGIYTTVSSAYDGGTDRTTITVSETVNSDTPEGRINIPGVVGFDAGSKTVTLGGNRWLVELAPGEMLNFIAGTGGGVHDRLLKIVSVALNADGVNTDITVTGTTHTGAVGRFQNASPNEPGLAWIDAQTFIALLRPHGAGGTATLEQFGSRDAGATGEYIGRANAAQDRAGVSPALVIRHIGGRAIALLVSQRRGTGTDFSLGYQTADAYALLQRADVWGPRRIIVSHAVAMPVAGGDPVTTDTGRPLHGYPSVYWHPSGTTALIVFSIETSATTTVLYAVPVRLDLAAYFGGFEDIATVTLPGSGNLFDFADCLAGYASVRLTGFVTPTEAGDFLARVSEDGGVSFVQGTNDYENYGNSGTAGSLIRLNNAAGAANVVHAVFVELHHLDRADVRTLWHAGGGRNNVSTSGGTVTGRRAAAAVATHLRVAHSVGAALITGTLRLVGSKTRQAG